MTPQLVYDPEQLLADESSMELIDLPECFADVFPDWGYSMRKVLGLVGRRQRRREPFLAQLQAASNAQRRTREVLHPFHDGFHDLESSDAGIEEEPA